MVESAYLDALQIHRTNRIALSRWSHKPIPRTARTLRPRDHGEIDHTKLYAGAVVELEGWLRGDTFAELVAAEDDLRGALALDGAGIVHRFRRSGRAEDERIEVRDSSGFEAPKGSSMRVLKWSAQLIAADPRVYSDVLKSASYDPTTAGEGRGVTFPLTFPLVFSGTGAVAMAVANQGNFRTPPVYTITGPATNPIVDNETTGASIYTTGLELLAGETLVLDVARRAALLGGTTPRADLISPTLTVWGDLAPGLNRIRLRGDDFAAGVSELSVTFRDARI